MAQVNFFRNDFHDTEIYGISLYKSADDILHCSDDRNLALRSDPGKALVVANQGSKICQSVVASLAAISKRQGRMARLLRYAGSAIEAKKLRGRPRSMKIGTDAGGSVQAIDRGLAVLAIICRLGRADAYRPVAARRARAVDRASHPGEPGGPPIRLPRRGARALADRRRRLRGRHRLPAQPAAGGYRPAGHARADGGPPARRSISASRMAGEVVFISQVESHSALRAFFRAGSRAAIHASGVGKALLAEMPEPRVKEILYKRGLAQVHRAHARRCPPISSRTGGHPRSRLGRRRRGAQSRHALRGGADLQ